MKNLHTSHTLGGPGLIGSAAALVRMLPILDLSCEGPRTTLDLTHVRNSIGRMSY
jgi:hypothetical protein